VCVLLISNYIRVRYADSAAEPSADAELARISERLTQAPAGEEVIEQIEALELRTKNAYTSDISLIRLDIFLLAAGAAVLLISSTLMFILRGGKPERTDTDTGRKRAIPAGLTGDMLIAGGGIGFVAIALIFLFLSYTTIVQDQRSMEAAIASLKTIQEAALERARIEAESIVYENYLAAEELRINWPSFRGPGGVGVAPKVKPPTAWNGTLGKPSLSIGS
jgi:hypothetical protein